MRSISSALSTALGAPVQKPAILVEAAFSTTYRWSSFSTVTWNGYTWTSTAIDMGKLEISALSISGELLIDRASATECALALSEGVQDRSFRIWGYDAAATALTDVVWLCDAVGGAVVADMDKVRIGLRHRTEFMFAPRSFVKAEYGFNALLPADRVLTINGISFTLERRT